MTKHPNETVQRIERRGFRKLKAARFALLPRPPMTRKQVVFVAGVQRSGTNMMINILDRSLHTDVFHEDDPRAFEHFEMRDLPVLQDLVARSKARTVVFKCLCELQDLRSLLDTWPDTKAVWNLRRLDDMVNSHAKARFKAGRQRLCPERINNLAQDPESEAWRGRGMASETQTILQREAYPDISHESAVALFWYLRNRLYFDQALQGDDRLRVVGYEHFVTDPKAHGAALFDWLGLPRSSYALDFVSPRSIGRWSAPAIDPSIRALCDDLAARFASEARHLVALPDG